MLARCARVLGSRCTGRALRALQCQSAARAHASRGWPAVGLGFASGVGVASSFAACEPRGEYAELDALFDENRYAPLAEVLRSKLERTPGDAQLLWRLGRALHKLADGEPDKKVKERYVREGLQLAERAVSLDPENGAAYKWAGILLSASGSFEGTTATIKNSFNVAERFERAVALSPKDATARHLLGLWHFEVAKLSWVEQKAAAAFFASPPRSTFEVAYAHFAAAEEIEPGFYPKNLLLLAQTCAKLNRLPEAREWLQKCRDAPLKTPEDEETLSQAAKLKI